MDSRLHDVIYLQISNPDEPIRIDETTWCSDKINDDDIKYLLSTPEREAAHEMYKALRKLRNPSYDPGRGSGYHRDNFWKAYETATEALALVDGSDRKDGG